MTKKRVWTGAIAVVAAAGAVAAYFVVRGGGPKRIDVETAVAATGGISNTVTATGTVAPLDEVDVGTQVSGVIEKIYADYNSPVKKGQLLAQLDMTTLTSTVVQAKASLESAKTEFDYLRRTYERTATLHEKGLVSDESLDKAKYDHERTKAALDKARAELQRAQIDLAYASIYSPIDGIVLSRAVDEGQTVAASLNAPVLFTIAHDLTKMEVRADVDEADIGQVREGQRVTFTVDAFPGRTFAGKVSQVRLEPTVTSNVVSYTVTISADNPDQKLMPGMTATVAIYTQELDGIMIVPAKALRFKPDRELMKAYEKQTGAGGRNPANAYARPRDAGADSASQTASRMQQQSEEDHAVVWVKKGGAIRPARIAAGVTDGMSVEVREGLNEGDEVVLSMSEASKKKRPPDAAGNNTSPFMPRRPRRAAR